MSMNSSFLAVKQDWALRPLKSGNKVFLILTLTRLGLNLELYVI